MDRKAIGAVLAGAALLVTVFIAFGGWDESSRLLGWAHQPPPFVDHGISDDEAFAKRPPQELPIRPIDYLRFPRAGFGFILRYSTGFEVDTFRGTMTKDLVLDPDTTITLRLSPAEMDSVYQAMIAMRLFDLPQPHPPFHSESGAQPSYATTLEAHAGSAVEHLEWSTFDQRPSDDWKRLDRLIRMIEAMVEREPEWEALPEPRGGYQ
jgi:hypothetical protein